MHQKAHHCRHKLISFTYPFKESTFEKSELRSGSSADAYNKLLAREIEWHRLGLAVMLFLCDEISALQG